MQQWDVSLIGFHIPSAPAASAVLRRGTEATMRNEA